MKMSLLLPIGVAMVVLVTGAVLAAVPVVDGTLAGDESAYGAALSIQNTDTEFGDALTGRG